MKETGLEHSDMPTDCGCFLDRGHCKRQGDHWKCDAACTTMLEGTYGIGYDVEAVFDGSKLNVTPVHGQTDCWEYN
jgi:hypothetical protein